MGRLTLRISFTEKEGTAEITLEGRVAGPWAVELDRFWLATGPQLATKELSIDLRNVTYMDAGGKRVLGKIHAQTRASLIAGTPYTQHLAAEVAANSDDRDKEHGNADTES